MEQSSMKGMWGRYFLFILLSIGILVGHAWMTAKRQPPAGPPRVAHDAAKAPEKPAAAPAKAAPAAKAPPIVEGRHPDRVVTLGSADPGSPYRALVHLTTRGGAVARIELNAAKYHDVEDRAGYLGQLALWPTEDRDGFRVEVVGPGTPAAEAKLRPGDVIVALDGAEVRGRDSLDDLLAGTRPGQRIELTVRRPQGDQTQVLTLEAELRKRPTQVVRPEANDPLSFLMTLAQLDERALEQRYDVRGARRRLEMGLELEGFDLRTANWEVVEPADPAGADEQVTFRRRLTQGLEITKTYRLAAVAEDEQTDPDADAYRLTLEVRVKNLGDAPRKVAYQLDGPTGLPVEGWWYASKVSPWWFTPIGLRDVVAKYGEAEMMTFACRSIAEREYRDPIEMSGAPGAVRYVGVDAQYFSAVMIPDRTRDEVRIGRWLPIAVGDVEPDAPNKTNTSFRLMSEAETLPPGGELADAYTVFVGPKKPALLAEHGLGEILYYGYFWWSARPMLGLLHFFHDWVVFNYGIAIVLLTVVVRGLMFPVSRQQALTAQKMQVLKPELARIKEKHKNDLQGMLKAQRELYQKHGIKHQMGCLTILIQLPVFIGLYRALMVDVELRGAPLITDAIRWASNLAGPDMLFDWSGFMPGFITRGVGFFGLGPYFNILPIITIILFLWQQKKLAPPAVDEQTVMMMKVMKYMMIVMGFLFYKVASGLCLYFIASSLWSIGEREFLPKREGETASGSEGAPVRVSSPRPAPRDAQSARRNDRKKRSRRR